MNATVATPATATLRAAEHAADPYSWPREDVGFSQQARTLRREARTARRTARAPSRPRQPARRARTWCSPEGVTDFASFMGMPVWGAVLTAMVFGTLIGSVLGLAVFAVLAV